MTRRPASPARSVRSSRAEKSYFPSVFSQAVHSIQVRTVLKPSRLIWSMSFFQISRDRGVTVSSMGARALPPAYQTETGKKPLVLSGPAADPVVSDDPVNPGVADVAAEARRKASATRARAT